MIEKVKITDADVNELAKIKFKNASQKDSFDYSKVVVKKPWGYEYLIFQNEFVGVWILYIKKGFQTSLHCHPGKKTALIVLSGEAICSTLNFKIKRTPTQGLLIDKGVFHSTKSISDGGVYVMEIETPVNKRDLARLVDRYGREGKGYEALKAQNDKISFGPNYNYNYIADIESPIYYNIKKRFDKCGIMLVKFKDNNEFKSNFKLKEWDLLCILKGQILNNKEDTTLDIGQCISLEDLNMYKGIKIKDELELMLVKKKDIMIRVSDYVISFLKDKKITKIFFVPGSANVHLMDSIARDFQIDYVVTQTEQAVTMAAEAYSKLTGNIGVSIISGGASGVNAIRGVANAWIDSTPILIISGQTNSKQTKRKSKSLIRQLGNKEVDIIDIVKPITKYAVMIDDPKKIKYHLQKAIYLAKTGRPGPVWLDIPIDLQGMNINEEELISLNPSELKQNTNIDIIKKKAKETIKLLKNAKRPLILAGNGIRLAKAEKEFMKLVNRLLIPVLTSRRGADLIEDKHTLFFGRPGAYGQRSANFIIQNSDLLISLGSRLSIPLIGRNYKSFARAAKKVIVDIDKHELKKSTINPDVAVKCDVKEFINELLTESSNNQKPDIGNWIGRCKRWRSKFPNLPKEFKLQKKSVDPYFFMDNLSDELREGHVIVVDGGTSLNFFMQAFKFKKKQRFISSTGIESPGFALYGSIGSCIGNNKKEVICICEGIGFQISTQEIQTIINYNLPVKIFILNNKGYSEIRSAQKQYFGARYTASNGKINCNVPDIRKISKAYGFVFRKISNHTEMKKKIRDILQNKKPVMCEINLDKDQQIIPRMILIVKSNGEWVSRPLEYMYPYLSKNEFKEEMIIDTLSNKMGFNYGKFIVDYSA